VKIPHDPRSAGNPTSSVIDTFFGEVSTSSTIRLVNKGTLDFDKLVERALEGLPPELSRLLDNVAIVVDDWPDYSTPLVSGGQGETLYGLYEGVPLTERGAGYYGFLPDKITIFRGPLERDFATRELEEQVRITVVHEIAHYFGFDEERLEELGWG
jgi:predicted Zn-dependent protease with MMP-like domain